MAKNKKKPHKSRNKNSKNNKKKSKKIQKVKKTAKRDAFFFTKMFVSKIKYIMSGFVFILGIRLLIKKSKINYISFILFFALQYFGYIILLLLSILSLEIIKVIFFNYVRTAVTKLFFGKPTKHKFLKNYPWFDYITTFIVPHLFIIGLYLFIILITTGLLFMFIIPFAILLLGYTK